MKWVTRERARVDRIACPWLISRFIDRDAVFLFVPSEQVMAVAKREGAIPYDVPGVELGHHGDRCSFDAFLDKYELNEPALQRSEEHTSELQSQSNLGSRLLLEKKIGYQASVCVSP